MVGLLFEKSASSSAFKQSESVVMPQALIAPMIAEEGLKMHALFVAEETRLNFQVTRVTL